MNKKIVLLLTAIFLVGSANIPALAVSGPFGYDLQKDIHRSKDKDKQKDNDQQQQQQGQQLQANGASSQVDNKPVTDDDIFTSQIAFNKVYYPNASIKSAVAKYKKGNYTGCLQELYTIVKKNPNNATAYYYTGMAYTKIGGIEQAKAAYQKVINMNANPVITQYALRGRDCLTGGINCVSANMQITEGDDLDKFIAAPYGNGLSPELNKQYKQQQLDALQNKINNGQQLSPEDLQKLRNLNNKSEAVTGEKIAMAADLSSMPSNEEVMGALDVLKRAGLNISAQTSQEEKVTQPVQNLFTPDTQIQQMSMMLNGGNYNNYDPMMNMLPLMMQNEGKNVDPQVIQAMMMNSMMNSLNGMNNNNNN